MTYVVKSPLIIALWECSGEVEVDAIITFRVTPGREATREEPGEAPEVEIIRFQLSSMGSVFADAPQWMVRRFENDDSFNSWLLQEAAERDEYNRECAAEAKAEERRMEGVKP